MLRSLSIRDIVLIDALDLELRPGLNVLTGETGAGKSILLDALGLALGAKGRGEMVRPGAAEGSVTAVFDLAPGHPARALLAEAGFEADDELVLRRVAAADGRLRAFVNDRRASGAALAALGEALVEVHGQHDDRGLLNAAGHRALLDAFAGCEAERAACRAAWAAWRDAAAALETARAAATEAARDEDFLRHAVAELTAFAPEAGEDARLDAERRRMQAAERIRSEVARAAEEIGPTGAEGALADAARRLDRAAAAAEGALDGALAALERAMTELGEAQAGVEAALDLLAYDPLALERAEERLFALRALARKHQAAPDDLPALTEALAARLAAIDGGAEGLAALSAAVEAADADYAAAAATLTAARRAAAARLDAGVAAELAPLKMERAVFRTEIAADAPGPDGADRVAFTVAPNPGAPAGPIGRIASGGELSRFLLALKVRLAARQEGLTLIFDEIDRGVGGATADAVGRRLARLAEDAQVLVVTHSPQVAARGAHHWRILKQIEGAATRTRVLPLSPREREEEIARMLAGETVTAAAKSAAAALLAG
ncbi:MAG: DNA repair protein RecN [Rhodobacteraceae bacterium]|nr:MAG: DNA repair protein RecN [Paracoccaceae bacterium]